MLVRVQIFLGTCQRPLKFTEDDFFNVILSGTLLSDTISYTRIMDAVGYGAVEADYFRSHCQNASLLKTLAQLIPVGPF